MNGAVVVAGLIALGALSAVGAEPTAPSATRDDFSPAQHRALDALVARVEQATRDAFEHGDWNLLADLYPPGTFNCWSTLEFQSPYSFLAQSAIPESATYSVIPVRQHRFEPSQDISLMQATHVVEIAYEQDFFAKCGHAGTPRKVKQAFFVRPRGEGFELDYFCPADPSRYLPAGFKAIWPSGSAAHAERAMEDMSAKERAADRAQLLADPDSGLSLFRFEVKHDLPSPEVYHAIDRLCELTTP